MNPEFLLFRVSMQGVIFFCEFSYSNIPQYTKNYTKTTKNYKKTTQKLQKTTKRLQKKLHPCIKTLNSRNLGFAKDSLKASFDRGPYVKDSLMASFDRGP